MKDTFNFKTDLSRRRPRGLLLAAGCLALACLLAGCDEAEHQDKRPTVKEMQVLVEKMTKRADTAYHRGLWQGIVLAGVVGLIAGAMMGSSARRRGQEVEPEPDPNDERTR